MKSIYDVFNTLSESDVNSVLDEYKIDIPANYLFSGVNIVIGKNGSGKTRFLNALKKLYTQIAIASCNNS